MSAPTTPDPNLSSVDQSRAPADPRYSQSSPSALSTALSRLVAKGTLTADQARAVLDEMAVASGATGAGAAVRKPAWSAVLAEIGGYVGGAFVVAAIAVFTGPNWDQISQAGRVALFALPALLLIVAAFIVARSTPGGWTIHEVEGSTPRRRLVAVLLAVASALGGGVAAVLSDNRVDDSLAFFLTAFVLGTISYALCRGFVLHAALAVIVLPTTMSLISELLNPQFDAWVEEQRWNGLALLAVAVVWAALALLRVLDEQALGLFAAGVLAFIAGQMLANGPDGEHWGGYLVLAGLAAAALIGYVRLRYVGLLGVGVVTLATVVPQAVIDYTDGALGAAGALLVTGLSIVGASAAGLRLRKEVTEDAAQAPASEA